MTYLPLPHRRLRKTLFATLASFAISGVLALAQTPATPAPAPAAPTPQAAPAPPQRRPPYGQGMQGRMGRPMGQGMQGRGGMQRGRMRSHRKPGGYGRAGMMRGGGPGGFRGGPGGGMMAGGAGGFRLTLTPDQTKKMDDIFQQSRIQLIDLKANVEKQSAMLEPLLSANPPDTAKAMAQIDKVAQARADLEKANAKMLLGIRGVLTPDQWTKLHTGGGWMGGGAGAPATPGSQPGPGAGGPGGGPGAGGPGRGRGPRGSGGTAPAGGEDFIAPDQQP